ncbi:MAG: PaaI family thioesterase [Elusimicrobiota bacterium]
MELLDDGWCFACGKNNPDGLQIDWVVKGDQSEAVYVPPKKFQGYIDVLHGGIIATLLDEAMGHLIWKAGYTVVSAEMNVRFVQMAKIGEKLFIHGKIEKANKRIVFASAEIRKEDQQLAAAATGKFIVPK